VPDDLRETFGLPARSRVTVQRGDQRRSYSICSPAGAPLRIGVREVQERRRVGLAAQRGAPGHRIAVQPPSGRFNPDLAEPAHHA